MTGNDSVRADTKARMLVAAVCVGVLALAVLRDGYAVESVDVRTYLEMTLGVTRHGLPYLDNGPADQLAPLRAPWNVTAHGHLWGVYGPAYAYFGAPFLALGGMRLLTAATCMVVALVALVTFLLGRRVLGDERYAALGAVVVGISTPILAKSLETTAYPLAVLFAVLATYAAVEAVSRTGRARLAWSAAVGCFGALGSASHLLDLPIAAALIGSLALCDATAPMDEPASGLARYRSFVPSASKLGSAAFAVIGLVACVVPVAMLNHVRFGSYNPYTYGPTPWRGSNDIGVADQTIGGHIRYGLPVIAVAVLVVVAFFLAEALPRFRGWARLAAVATGALVLIAHAPWREKAVRYVQAACGFIVDQSLLPLAPPYGHVPGTFGHFFGPWVIKSTLQCTPILALAMFLPRLDARTRHRALVTLAPAAAMYAYLILRANLPLHSGLGFPWVYIRYTMPALPMLAVGALFAIRDVGLGKREIAIAALVGIALTAILFGNDRDAPIFRQIVVLVVPVAAVAAAIVLMLLARRQIVPRAAAAIAIAATLGIGIGIGLGHDLRANIDGKTYLNHRVRAVAAVIPQRCAFMGYLGALDNVLSLRVDHDIEYADLFQVDDWTKARPVIDRWFAEGRPVFYAVEGAPPVSPWPDVAIDLVEPGERIYRVTRKQ